MTPGGPGCCRPWSRSGTGLWSVPVPIPDNPLRYTLSYAFTGDAGTLIVDPGWASADGRRALTAGLATAGVTLGDVTGIVVTHIHPDHHGQSGWVREESGAWIAMHAAEAETLPARIWPDQEPGADQDWLRRHGVPGDDAARPGPGSRTHRPCSPDA